MGLPRLLIIIKENELEKTLDMLFKASWLYENNLSF